MIHKSKPSYIGIYISRHIELRNTSTCLRIKDLRRSLLTIHRFLENIGNSSITKSDPAGLE